MEEKLIEMFEVHTNAEICRLRDDLVALRTHADRRERELAEESRRLWAATGHLRAAYTTLLAVTDNDDYGEAVDLATDRAAAAEVLLDPLFVPLTPTK